MSVTRNSNTIIRFAGEPALAAPESVSWRIFKNPVALYIGGMAAVLLELPEAGIVGELPV